jgi:hypothetical protein
MAKTNLRELGQSFELIVGETLSDVQFVLDYWQLQFDGPSMNIMTPIELRSGELVALDGGFRFREHMCDQIGKTVTGAELSETALKLTLEDGSTISISLRDEDYHGPEAILLLDASRRPLVAI